MNEPDWDHVRTFLAIVRERSLSGAARRLRLTQPTVGRHLDELEDALGGKLFTRSTSGLVPTELARTLERPATDMELAQQELVRRAGHDGAELAGTVRVTASEVVGAMVLPPILVDVRRRHPGLSIELHLSDDLEDLPRAAADVAVRMVRPSDSGLVARRLPPIALGLFAARSWIEHNGEPATLEEAVASGALIGADRDRRIVDALLARNMPARRSDFGLRTDSAMGQLALCRAGGGIAVWQVPLVAREAALVRVLASFEHSLDPWLVTHVDLKRVPAVRAVLEAVAAGLSRYVAGG